MCPSFSLCACRILKMRSCLRRPLAPGSSKDRAILVSSVMFFSFSSAMVIITYGMGFLWGVLRVDFYLPPCGAHGGGRLRGPPLCFVHILWFAQYIIAFRIGDLVENL